jgi:hypothetical protein
MQMHADTSDFRFTEGDTASIAFKTDNVNATVKLDERVGEFVSNGTETKVEFPVNQYICYMDRFKWFMDQGDIELESDRTAAVGNEDLQLSGSNFISIRPDQDSAQFHGPQGALRPEEAPDHRQRCAIHPGGRCAWSHRTACACVSAERRDGPAHQHGDHGQLRHQVPPHLQRHGANIKAKRSYTADGRYRLRGREQAGASRSTCEGHRVDTAFQTVAAGASPRSRTSS